MSASHHPPTAVIYLKDTIMSQMPPTQQELHFIAKILSISGSWEMYFILKYHYDYEP